MERWLVQTLAPTAAHGFACDALWSVRAANPWHTRHRWHERAPATRDLLRFITTFYFLKHDRSSMRTRPHHRSRARYDPADRSVRECGRARRSNGVQADVAALKEDCVTPDPRQTPRRLTGLLRHLVPSSLRRARLLRLRVALRASRRCPGLFRWRKEQSQLMKKSMARPRNDALRKRSRERHWYHCAHKRWLRSNR